MSGLASGAAAVKGVVDTSARIAKSMEPYFKIENQELTLHAPDRTGSLRIFASVKNNWRKSFAKSIKFQHPEVFRFQVCSLPMGRAETQAISKIDGGFSLSPANLSDCDALMLDFDFNIQNERFVDALVKTTTKQDTQDEHDDYWITAQLRHPAALKARNYSIDLRDVDFNVDVAVHQDIKDIMPKPFLDNLDTIAQWIKEHDRNKKLKLSMKHLKQKGVGLAGQEVELLNKIQDVFVPSRFEEYVSVRDMFRLSEVRRGMEFYESIPNRTFPRSMTVVSRTDLNLDTCAADGVVKYNKVDFKDALAKLFPQGLRPNKKGS